MANHFFKSKSLFSTTLSSSISTGTSDTITLASVVGLPTDTEVTLTFERVDATGAKTPTKMERIRGTISGSNLISYTRAIGSEGTEQAHLAGSVIEMVFNAKDWNDAVDGILVEHNQDGTHAAATVTTLKASGANVTTGTSDVTIVTPKALKDAGIDVTASSTTTFTNKRITKRVQSVTDAATVTPDADANDVVDITAIAQAFTIANPSGTPTNFQTLIIRIKDNATAHGITWGNGYVAGGVALPSTTVLSKILTLGFIYNTANSLNKWQLIASSLEA